MPFWTKKDDEGDKNGKNTPMDRNEDIRNKYDFKEVLGT